jgi:hypothetical protein
MKIALLDKVDGLVKNVFVAANPLVKYLHFYTRLLTHGGISQFLKRRCFNKVPDSEHTSQYSNQTFNCV